MAFYDVFMSQDGTDGVGRGTSWATRVKTFQGANLALSLMSPGDTPRLYIGRYDLVATFSLLTPTNMNYTTSASKRGVGNYTNNAWNGATETTVTVPDGVQILPYDANQNVHINTLKVVGTATTDWVRLKYNTSTKAFNATTGTDTNVWRCIEAVNQFVPTLSAYRLWRGGLANGMSARQPENEIFEAGSLADLGMMPDSQWTMKAFPTSDGGFTGDGPWDSNYDSATVTFSTDAGGRLTATVPSTWGSNRFWRLFATVNFTTTGTLPTTTTSGLTAGQFYTIVPVPGQLFQYQFALDRESALAGTLLLTSSLGSGTHTMQQTPTALLSTNLHVHCAGNPATVWGGVTLHTREATYNGIKLVALNGAYVSEDIIINGGGSGDILMIDNCYDTKVEAQVYCAGLRNAICGIYSTASGFDGRTENRNISVAPAYDSLSPNNYPMLVNGGDHSYGSSDMVQFSGSTAVSGMTLLEKSTSGRQSFIKNPVHSGFGVQNTINYIRRLTIQPGVQFVGGAHKYQRAMGINGTAANFTDFVVGGDVSGFSAPQQWGGQGIFFGLKIRGQRPLYETSPGGTVTVTDKWGYARQANNNLDWDVARYREPAMVIGPGTDIEPGHIIVDNCDFEVGGAAMLWTYDGTGSQSLTVQNSVFREGQNKAWGFKSAIMIGDTNNAGSQVRCINNTRIGNITGSVWTTTTITQYELADMSAGGVLGANGFAVNTGWSYYPTAEDYEQEQARAKVA